LAEGDRAGDNCCNIAGRKVVKALYNYSAPSDDIAASGDLDLKANDVLEVLNESVELQHYFLFNIATIIVIIPSKASHLCRYILGKLE
jgi:hypothetical protein